MSAENKSTFWNNVRTILRKGNRNHFTVFNKEKSIFSVSINVFILLLLILCPVGLVLMLVGLFCGCRYHFSGPDFPEDNQLNRFFDKLSGGLE